MKKTFLLGGVLLLALGLLYVWYYFFVSSLSVVSISIVPGTTDVSFTPEIRVDFDKAIYRAIKGVEVSSDPSADWKMEILSNKKSILLKPEKELGSFTEYALLISGNRINKYELKFTTKAVEFGVGSPEAQTAFENYKKAFPILNLLPYKTEKYTIMQSQKDEYFVIVFGIYESELENIKKEVFAWFQAKGVNPENVKIDFE